jgi:FtsZ-binding cell division protein ZapB
MWNLNRESQEGNMRREGTGKSPESALATVEDMDQFQLLEEKVDSLIKYITALKKENESLAEELYIQKEKITDLTQEVEHLREARGKDKHRVVTLLERIEQVDI